MVRKRTGQRVTRAKVPSGQHKTRSDKRIVSGRRWPIKRTYRASPVSLFLKKGQYWTARRFSALTSGQQTTYFRAKKLLGALRGGESVTLASRDSGTTVETARKYFPNDIKKIRGEWRAVTRSDRHVNEIVRLTKGGFDSWILEGSRNASLVSRYLNDVYRAWGTQDFSILDKWRGKKIGGKRLITDKVTINKLGDADQLKFDDGLRWRSS